MGGLGDCDADNKPRLGVARPDMKYEKIGAHLNVQTNKCTEEVVGECLLVIMAACLIYLQVERLESHSPLSSPSLSSTLTIAN